MNSKQKFNIGDLVEFKYSNAPGVIIQIDLIPWRGLQYRVHLLDGRKSWTTEKNIKKVA